jgi:Fis family transcriptional regulator
MNFTHGNQTKAALILGINRGTLRKKLRQYGLG